MSCNGCRVLRKGCSDSCILRPCLQWIDGAEAQGHATLFVAKFFGRAGLVAFLSSVPDPQRPALFRSLLFEACGRTINPVHGAVGLLWSGNWHLCQAAVDSVLRGGALRPLPDPDYAMADDGGTLAGRKAGASPLRSTVIRREDAPSATGEGAPLPCDLQLCLSPRSSPDAVELEEKLPRSRPGTPLMHSEGSGVTTSGGSSGAPPGLLNLFV